MSADEILPGGRDAGAVRRGEVVVRATGAWTPAVHHLLAHLDSHGFDGAPRPIGWDAEADYVSFLAGETVGERRPWPAWVHSDDALAQVARWLSRYHRVVSDYRPPPDARWRELRDVAGADVIVAHNDAAPYNAVWRHDQHGRGRLVGFVDWDMAGPRHRLDDLAWTAFAWVPLHARRVVSAEGIRDFGRRRERLQLFLDAYTATDDRSGPPGPDLPGSDLLASDLLDRVGSVLDDHIRLVRALASAGDRSYQQMITAGRLDDLVAAREELAEI